ncbi:hypothetical protein EVAR_16476_1 [Eumeta japonica]|uniref:Uncharacterized protein n=1 Tax=Eumeta variegata TaxID=151549 RepID=A0A4C1UM02_EUMVA|nr:hypothetical protein EVAR_16476_1 [Eumeta japonica]
MEIPLERQTLLCLFRRRHRIGPNGSRRPPKARELHWAGAGANDRAPTRRARASRGSIGRGRGGISTDIGNAFGLRLHMIYCARVDVCD